MSYYAAGDRPFAMPGTGDRRRVMHSRTNYYSAGGGFFKKLRKGVGKLAKFAAKASPLLAMVNPALGAIVAGGAQLVGRTNTLLNPAAAPSGMPSEGAPPGGAAASRSTQGGVNKKALFAALLKAGWRPPGRR